MIKLVVQICLSGMQKWLQIQPEGTFLHLTFWAAYCKHRRASKFIFGHLFAATLWVKKWFSEKKHPQVECPQTSSRSRSERAGQSCAMLSGVETHRWKALSSCSRIPPLMQLRFLYYAYKLLSRTKFFLPERDVEETKWFFWGYWIVVKVVEKYGIHRSAVRWR